MVAELETIVLTTDLPDLRLKRGDIGTVVLLHGQRGYEVEFVTLDGETVGVASLTPDQVHPVAEGEIASARPVEPA